MLQAWVARDEHAGTHGPRRRVLGLGGIQRRGLDVRRRATRRSARTSIPRSDFSARRDYKKIEGRIFRRVRPADLGKFFELRPHIVYRGYWDFEGFQETGFLHMDTHWELKSEPRVSHRSESHARGLERAVRHRARRHDSAWHVRARGGCSSYIVGDLSAPLNFEIRVDDRRPLGRRPRDARADDRLPRSGTNSARSSLRATTISICPCRTGNSRPICGGCACRTRSRRRCCCSSSRSTTSKPTSCRRTCASRGCSPRTRGCTSSITRSTSAASAHCRAGREFVIKYSRIFDLLR